MRPTPREWLGAGLLALALVALILILVATAMPGGDATGAAFRALLGT